MAAILLAGLLASSSACIDLDGLAGDGGKKPRLTMFIGVDVSGSFMKGGHYEDSLEFLANYVYAHLKGLGGLEPPRNLFLGTLGGSRKDEARTLFPIQTFEGKTVPEIRAKLAEILPKTENPYTDFNAFFEQVATTVRNKNLVLRPLSIVLLSDGEPDFPDRPGKEKSHSVRDLEIDALESLSRNITVRLLYTTPSTGAAWQNQLRRQRVKIWTQDAVVMTQWKDPKIFEPGKPLEEQTAFFGWIRDNVDFGVRVKRVN
ncbi:MAG: hypothetical protein NDJ89_14995 [Oligoflexia bacterium]|nr:hypothetical protein [Oligoflexia bacterium]